MKKMTVGMVAILGAASTAFGGDVFTSEADFVAAIDGGYYLENFDAYAYGDYQDYTLDLAQDEWAYTVSASGVSMSFLWSGDSCMSTNSADDGLLVEFTGTLPTAIGGYFYSRDISGYYIPGPMVLELRDGTVYEFDAASASDFRGFTTDVGITSIFIESPDVAGPQWSTMDQFYVGAVPAPGALALLGLAGLAGRRRR